MVGCKLVRMARGLLGCVPMCCLDLPCYDRYAMSCHDKPYFAVRCRAMLCHAMPCHAMQAGKRDMLCCAVYGMGLRGDVGCMALETSGMLQHID